MKIVRQDDGLAFFAGMSSSLLDQMMTMPDGPMVQARQTAVDLMGWDGYGVV